MSGTSLDGIDASIMKSDGQGFAESIDFISLPYDDADRAAIRAAFGLYNINDAIVQRAEEVSTQKHIQAVEAVLKQAGLRASDIDLIGYHGQTIYHAPQDNVTVQIGDGLKLSQVTGIDVVNDFRSADVKAGGEGAPLIPLYHQALMSEQKRPVAIVNIGGVSNITYLGEENDILAFDTGTGNAFIDDLVVKNTNQTFDIDGAIASAGRVQTDLINKWVSADYFKRIPPKSLDRDGWNILDDIEQLSFEDSVATLTAFTVAGIIEATKHLPSMPENWFICGGGGNNKTMMQWLEKELPTATIKPIEALGFNGDSIEAEGFGYLAVRSVLGLPLSVPTTTSVPEPMSGGKLYQSK